MTATASREQHSVKTLLDSLKKAARFSGGMVISVVPRGGLQIVQPANVPDSILKAYARDLAEQDRLSWQTILNGKPMRAAEAYPKAGFDRTAYATEVLASQELKYAVALPLAHPVIAGYPGVVHLFRDKSKGDFSAKDITALMRVINQLEIKHQPSKKGGKRARVPNRLFRSSSLTASSSRNSTPRAFPRSMVISASNCSIAPSAACTR